MFGRTNNGGCIMIEFFVTAIFFVSMAVVAWVEFHEVVSEIKILNPEGDNNTALIVYQKGLRDFQPRVAFAFAEGLVSKGWRVEITTVSSHAPTDISRYDLLVIGWPTYMFNPSLPLRRYLKRIGDLKNKGVVIICTAAGAPAGSCEKMNDLVQATNGVIVKTFTLFSMRPNEGNSNPMEIATKIGKEIPLQRAMATRSLR
jgi:flavorubredoxin